MTTNPSSAYQPTQPMQPVQHDPRHRRLGWSIIAALIILVLLGAGALWYAKSHMTKGVQIAPGATLTNVSSGNIAAQFPAGLVPANVSATASYRIDYSGSAGSAAQPVVEYVTQQSLRDAMIAFRTYFVQNGWELIQPGRSSENPTFILASKGSASAHIALQTTGEGTKVTIAYLVNR